MIKKIKIGVLGCSKIAEKSVIPAIVHNSNFELCSVSSRDIKKAKEYADRFNAHYCTYDELVKNNDIDAIYVSLPVGLHYEWGKKVVESGKHLLLEKTFTESYEQTLDIIKTAEEKKVVAMEALMYIYHPLFSKVIYIINSGIIGELRSIEAAFGFPDLPESDIRNQKALGGGAILDNLIYPLSLCLYLAKEECLDYDFRIFNSDKFGIDSRGHILLNFTRFSAHITYGFGFMYRNEYLIWGSEGYLKVTRGFSRPANLEGEIILVKQNSIQEIKVEAEDHFLKMLDAFFNKVNGSDLNGLNEGKDIINRMKIISDIYQSNR